MPTPANDRLQIAGKIYGNLVAFLRTGGENDMAYFLFIDESGQDHRDSPYEVLAGVAIEDRDAKGTPILRLEPVERATLR